MSYPEGLRDYQGSWPPPKDFLLSPDDAESLGKIIPSWGWRFGKVVVAASFVRLILPNIDFHRIPVLGALFHWLGLIIPMIQAVALYSQNSLADVSGVSVLVIGIIVIVVPSIWGYFRKAFAIENYSLLMRYIHVGYAPLSRSDYLIRWIAVCVVGLVAVAGWIASDIQGYVALYIYHTPLRNVATNHGYVFGLLSANGLNIQHGVASSFYFFGTLRRRFEFPVFAIMYGASLAAYALFIIIEIIIWTHAGAMLTASREDWRILGRMHKKRGG